MVKYDNIVKYDNVFCKSHIFAQFNSILPILMRYFSFLYLEFRKFCLFQC